MYTEELLVLIWPMYFAVYPGSADITTQILSFYAVPPPLPIPWNLREKICGRSFINIARSGAGISERIYCLVQPEEKLNKDGIPYGKESVINVAADLLPQLMERRESFLALPDPEKMWRSW